MGETRKLAAILVSDVVGYSRLAGADEDRILARLRALRSDLIDPTISVHHGRIVKRTGDGSVIEFRSVVDAVNCAIEVQRSMVERNAEVAPDKRIEFRIGIHVGDVVEESDGDLMGDGVNIAARLAGIAAPGTICLSEQAYWQVKGRLDLKVTDLGPVSLKNIAEPMRVYSLEVGMPAVAKPAPTPAPEKSAPLRLSIIVLPFANIGGDPEQEHFVDGVTESLTTDLSRIRGAVVIARNTAFTYKSKLLDVKTISALTDISACPSKPPNFRPRPGGSPMCQLYVDSGHPLRVLSGRAGTDMLGPPRHNRNSTGLRRSPHRLASVIPCRLRSRHACSRPSAQISVPPVKLVDREASRSRRPKVRIVRSDARQHHRFAERGTIAPERLDPDVGGAGRKTSVQRAHLGVDFGEPRERLGDRCCDPRVVVDDQLSGFLGELLRSRQIGGGPSVAVSCAEACEFALQRNDPGLGDVDFRRCTTDDRISILYFINAGGRQHFAPAKLKLAHFAPRVGKGGALGLDDFEHLRLIALNGLSDIRLHHFSPRALAAAAIIFAARLPSTGFATGSRPRAFRSAAMIFAARSTAAVGTYDGAASRSSPATTNASTGDRPASRRASLRSSCACSAARI